MTEPHRYSPTKLVLYQVVPAIIERYRISDGSDGTAGRRSGKATLDEVAGGHDVLYHLMCTDTIALMAQNLGISRQRIFDAIDIGLHSIDPGIMERFHTLEQFEAAKPSVPADGVGES